MQVFFFLSAFLVLSSGVVITSPCDGETYTGNWLTLRATVTNDNQEPDSVTFALNGEVQGSVPRLSTDWPTYMGNNCRTGFSESPAPLDNTVLWAADSITGDQHEFCGPVVVNGVVYHVSDKQSTVFALDAVTGGVLWEYFVTDDVDDAVSFYQGKIYVAADSAFCLSAETGERVWAFKPAGSNFKMNGTPAVDGGVAYFTWAPDWSSMDVYALEAETGEVLWCTGLPSYSTGCVSLSGDRLFVPTYQGLLYCLDRYTGSILWTNSASADGYWDSSPVVVQGMIYICGSDGTVRAIDAATGETVWENALSSWYIAATPVFAYESIFFADQVDSFFRLGSDTGGELWSVPGVQHGSSAVADSMVFFGEGADRSLGQIRALSVADGSEVWSYQTGGAEIYSSPAVTDGIVYIAGMDWKLYALGSELQYTYRDDLFTSTGTIELVVSSWAGGSPAAADTVTFTVSGTGFQSQCHASNSILVSPNPFSSSTAVNLSLPESQHVSVVVYDVSGRTVRTLHSGSLLRGENSFTWDGTDSSGSRVPPGLYICAARYGSSCTTAGICLLD